MYVPPMADAVDLCRFHSKDYIDFISRVTPHNLNDYAKFLQQYNVMEDWCVLDTFMRWLFYEIAL